LWAASSGQYSFIFLVDPKFFKILLAFFASQIITNDLALDLPFRI